MTHEEVMRRHPLQRQLRGEKVTPEDWSAWEASLKGVIQENKKETVSKSDPVYLSTAQPTINAVTTLSPCMTDMDIDQSYHDEENKIIYDRTKSGEIVVTIY